MASHSNTKPGRKQQLSANNHERRKRPRKLRVLFNDEQPHQHGEDLYQHDISSFVSTCAPGISFGKSKQDSNPKSNHILSPRAPPIHKRQLPSLSFLATTTIAAEKKRLKIEEEKRKEIIAEMEARKVLALNPNDSIDMMGEGPSKIIGEEQSTGLQCTTVIETSASNVIMPPLLKHFLDKSVGNE